MNARVAVAVSVAWALSVSVGFALGYAKAEQRKEIGRDVTCTYSPYTKSIINCVGDGRIPLEGRCIRLVSEPLDGGGR